jgi:hypothetical protein
MPSWTIPLRCAYESEGGPKLSRSSNNNLKNHALIKLDTEVMTVIYKRHLAYSPTNQ